MKIHVLPATCLALLASLSSCKKDQTALEVEILRDQARCVELSQKTRLLEMRWDRLAPGHEHAEVVLGVAEEATETLLAMRREREQLIVDLAKLEKDIVVARQEQRRSLRVAAIGKKFPSFAAKHRVYENVTIVEVDDMGIQLRHEDGLTRVTASKLTAQQMAEFGIDADIAQQAQVDEAKQIAAYNQMVDQALAKQKKEQRYADLSESIASAAPVITPSRSTRPSNFGKMTSSFNSPYGSSSRLRRYRDSYYDTNTTVYYYGSNSSSRQSASSYCPPTRVSPISPRPPRPVPTPPVLPGPQ